ncbi:MAG: response regulator [Clostridiales bacterium]|nr:response regulator [Clostridiales bacterium]
MNIRSKIILVDDNMTNLTMCRNILKTFYEVYPAPSAAKLFEILDKVIPELILLDIELPDMNGFEIIKELKEDKRFSGIPVIFLTSKNDAKSELEGFNLGAVDYISIPFSKPLLLKRISNQLLIVNQKKELLEKQAELADYNKNLEVMVREKTNELLKLQNAVIATIADLAEFRDEITGGHIMRTTLYMRAMAKEMVQRDIYREEMSKWDMDFLLSSAQLHDVGKIAISDSILNKPGKLTPDEFEIMKGHVTIGMDAIEKIISNTAEHAFLRHALFIVGTHHEKWDGSGYPIGLKGKDIPLEGQLMAVADVYDALVSVRPYKEAFTHEKSCKIIEESAGAHFDPVLVDVFRGVETEFAKIAQRVNNWQLLQVSHNLTGDE